MPNLTLDQSAAVYSRQVPIVVSAGAGSGKTTVLVEKYLTLLKNGMTPQQILLVTFTKDATEQLRERILARLKDERFNAFIQQQTEETPYIGTLHSFCYHVVEQWGRALSLPPIEKITDSFQEAEVLGEEFDSWLATLEGSTRESIFQSYSWSDIRVLAFQLYQKRHSLKGIASDFSRFNDILTLLSPFFEKVKTKLLQKGAYSFDDLEYYAVHILNEIPDSLSFYRNQLKQLCVDEFQDTSPAQWELVQLLTGLDYSKLFLVGDPKQSIYRFRQADVGIFLEATEKISHEKGDFLTLQDNFRSHPEIIYWINQKAQSLFIESSIPYSTLNHESRF
jgi:DNA helicase-2/ATP-dependent DNA helicase PcrA